MRNLVLVAVLVASLSLPVFANASAALPFSLRFQGTTSSGTISGTFGGEEVSGTYSNNTWTLTVFEKPFATGTYSCSNSGCTFTDLTLLGKSIAFSLPSVSLTTKAGSMTVTEALSLSQFTNHGAWVSAVANWANTHLTGRQIGQAVSAAARIEGKEASEGKGKGKEISEEKGKGTEASEKGAGGHRK